MQYTEEEALYQQQVAAQLGQGIPPIYQTPPPSKDQELMEDLLNFKKQLIEPLVHSWRGDKQDKEGNWIKRSGFEMMNELGICWCSGKLETFLNSTFSMSNLDEKLFNWNVRLIGKTIHNGVSMLYLEWKLRKQNIPDVTSGIIQTCVSVLLMARGNGLRNFLSTTHQVNEMRSSNLSPQLQPQQKRGLFGIFRSKPPQIQQITEEGYRR